MAFHRHFHIRTFRRRHFVKRTFQSSISDQMRGWEIIETFSVLPTKDETSGTTVQNLFIFLLSLMISCISV